MHALSLIRQHVHCLFDLEATELKILDISPTTKFMG
jgi:hypothetical protein